jgi:hypothetical protein
MSFCLLRLFRPLTLAETDPWAAAVLVDEFDTCFLESSPDFVTGYLSTAEPAFRGFQALYGWKRDVRSRS